MSGLTIKPCRYFVAVSLLACLPVPGFAQSAADEGGAAKNASEPVMETVSLTVDGINTTSGEDNPGVVYILPWQPPTLPRRTREALETNASELLSPIDPVVFERHQNFQKSLNPTLDSTNSPR